MSEEQSEQPADKDQSVDLSSDEYQFVEDLVRNAYDKIFAFLNEAQPSPAQMMLFALVMSRLARMGGMARESGQAALFAFTERTKLVPAVKVHDVPEGDDRIEFKLERVDDALGAALAELPENVRSMVQELQKDPRVSVQLMPPL